MRVWVNVEVERSAFLSISGIGLERVPVRHHDLNLVIFGMNIFLHKTSPLNGWPREAAEPFRPVDRNQRSVNGFCAQAILYRMKTIADKVLDGYVCNL